MFQVQTNEMMHLVNEVNENVYMNQWPLFLNQQPKMYKSTIPVYDYVWTVQKEDQRTRRKLLFCPITYDNDNYVWHN